MVQNIIDRSKLLAFAIVLLPILDSSHIGDTSIGFGTILLIAATIWAVIFYGRLKISLGNKKMFLYMMYFLLISLICCSIIPSFSLINMAVQYTKYAIYAVSIFGAYYFCDWEWCKKLYINVCFLESIYAIIQLFLNVTTNIRLPFVFPYTTMEYGMLGSEYNARLINIMNFEGFRAVGFFPEPSHFAEYTIFSIIFLMDQKNKSKGSYMKLVVISAALFLSMSSIGLLAYAMIFIVYYIRNMQHTGKNKFFALAFAGVLLVIGFIYAGIEFGVFDFIQNRLSTISEKKWAVSGNTRLLRGFMVYGKSNIFVKIFGFGAGNYKNFIDHFQISTFFDLQMNKYDEYMNGASFLLLHSGLIGALLYLSFCVNLYKDGSQMKKMLLLVNILIFFTEYFFFTPIYVMSMFFIMLSDNNAFITRRKKEKFSIASVPNNL